MITAKVIGYDGHSLVVVPSEPLDRELMRKQVGNIEIRLDDGRTISADQRKKTFAIIRDIGLWSGHEPEDIRKYLIWDFAAGWDGEVFSLSDVDMTTARYFINYLINFCFKHNVPTKKPLLEHADDIGRYLYLCLEHRKCAVCNKRADVHHVDRVGMGFNRNKINHVGLRAIALCREHHQEAHQDEVKFFEKHKLYGIKLDEYLVKVLGL